MSKETVYKVDWHLNNVFGMSSVEATSKVVIIDGYTTVEDIPKIIAVSRAGDPNLAYLVIIDKVTEVTD